MHPRRWNWLLAALEPPPARWCCPAMARRTQPGSWSPATRRASLVAPRPHRRRRPVDPDDSRRRHRGHHPGAAGRGRVDLRVAAPAAGAPRCRQRHAADSLAGVRLPGRARGTTPQRHLHLGGTGLTSPTFKTLDGCASEPRMRTRIRRAGQRRSQASTSTLVATFSGASFATNGSKVWQPENARQDVPPFACTPNLRRAASPPSFPACASSDINVLALSWATDGGTRCLHIATGR